MAFITWNEKYETHIGQIDQQHQKLVEMLEELFQQLKQGKAEVILGKILTQLIDYTGYHFKTEEKYMQDYGYPYAMTHKQQHEQFVKKVQEFKEAFDRKSTVLSVKVMDFLKSWLIEHIQDHDKKLGKFIYDQSV